MNERISKAKLRENSNSGLLLLLQLSPLTFVYSEVDIRIDGFHWSRG